MLAKSTGSEVTSQSDLVMKQMASYITNACPQSCHTKVTASISKTALVHRHVSLCLIRPKKVGKRAIS